jgi:hypothetical protein
MKFLLLALVFYCLSGTSCSTKKTPAEAIIGNWLILYPDHHLRTKTERDVYGKYQDSIINLYGLKLISIKENGEFTEVDSLFRSPGKWIFSNDKKMQIREGGRGFNPFTTAFKSIENDTLRLQQSLSLDKEKIEVVWHLKKVDEDTIAIKLFSPEANQWRVKPTSPESDAALRKRLVLLLNYYSDYLKLVSQEAEYFLIPRVHLPFRYYQHAIGLQEKMTPGFVNLFYNEEEAKKGVAILQNTLNQLSNEFEWGDNFVLEYAEFFKRMANWLGQ